MFFENKNLDTKSGSNTASIFRTLRKKQRALPALQTLSVSWAFARVKLVKRKKNSRICQERRHSIPIPCANLRKSCTDTRWTCIILSPVLRLHYIGWYVICIPGEGALPQWDSLERAGNTTPPSVVCVFDWKHFIDEVKQGNNKGDT